MLHHVLYLLFFAFVQCSSAAQEVVTIWDLPDVTITETVRVTTKICPECTSTPALISASTSTPGSTTTVLQPNIHWNHDANNPSVLTPNSQVPQYYAPQSAGK